MIEAGHFAAILALVFSAVQAFTGLRGNRGQSGLFAQLAFAAMVFAFFTLLWAFARSDFSVQLVAANSHTLKPFVYKLAGTWGNHEGSMALWCVVGLGFGAAGAWLLKSDRPVFEARALGVQGILSLSSLLYLLLASSPFTRLDPAPLQGQGLNPLLQDPALAIHPPMLYLGYVGYSFVFALAAAGLIEKRVDRQWAKTARPWALAAFVPLSLGIALGSYWAYYELGWGGWWFWDAVENASFMPWLVGTALIHSLAVTEKRGLFKSWTLLLAISAFSLSLLGTFLVRSGIIVSVHAFATDPTRGFFILTFLAVVVIGALILYAWRAPSLDSDAGFGLLSRETFLLLNNVLLVVAAALVLIGTLAPLVVEMMTGGKISIGPPWFNIAFLVPTLPLIVLLGMGMHTAWRTQKTASWWRLLRIPAIVSLVLGVIIPLFIYGRVSVLLVVGCSAAAWIIISSLIQPVRSLLREKGTAGIPRSALGMSVAHLGMGLFVIGVTVVSAFGIESDQALQPGESIEVGGFEFHMVGLSNVRGPNFSAIEAEIEIRRDGEFVDTIRPQKRQYLVQKSWMTEAGIRAGLDKDLFVALGDQLGQNAWSVRVQYKPLIRFIWLGALVMALGGLIAISDRRYRRSGREAEARTSAAEAAA